MFQTRFQNWPDYCMSIPKKTFKDTYVNLQPREVKSAVSGAVVINVRLFFSCFFPRPFVGRGSNVVTDVASLDKTFMSQPRGKHFKRKSTNVCSQRGAVIQSWVPVFRRFLLHFTRFSSRENPSFVFQRDCFPAALQTDF